MSEEKKYRVGNHYVKLSRLEVGGWNGSGTRSTWVSTVVNPDSSEVVVGRFDTERLALEAGQRTIRKS